MDENGRWLYDPSAPYASPPELDTAHFQTSPPTLTTSVTLSRNYPLVFDQSHPASSSFPLHSFSGIQPPYHQAALASAVESSRWTAAAGVCPPSPSAYSPAFPTLYQSPLSPTSALPPFDASGSPPALQHTLTRSPTTTVGQLLAAFPSAVNHLPSSGALAGRRGSGGGLDSKGLIDSPIDLAPRVKPFIAKLYRLLSHPEEFQDVIAWADDSSFIVNANHRFISEILPNVYNHSQLSSFTRQLNVYGFTRLSTSDLLSRLEVASASASDLSGWSHPQFQRNDTSTLYLLTPRPSRARLLKKAEKEEKMAQKEREAKSNVARRRSTSIGVGDSGTLGSNVAGLQTPTKFMIPSRPRTDSYDSNFSASSAFSISSLDDALGMVAGSGEPSDTNDAYGAPLNAPYLNAP